MEQLSFDDLTTNKTEHISQASGMLLTLDDLDTLGNKVGSRVRKLLDDGSVGGYSILKVQENVKTVLEELGIGISQVLVEKGEFAGETLDKIFSR